MKVLIATDKFKGSRTAEEVGEAIKKGILRSHPRAKIQLHPMADGGDGSIDILAKQLALQKITLDTVNAIGDPISSFYYCSADAAFIETASASGIAQLTPEHQNPMHTSTVGTGKIIEHAISKGLKNIYLFLGGSATNDAGTGIAQALGYQFLDKAGNPLSPVGKNLIHIDQIIAPVHNRFNSLDFKLLCDVENPFFGIQGAAHVYAPQKGANVDEVKALDKGLQKFAILLKEFCGKDISLLKGSGAAGGIAGGLVALLDAKLESGFSTIASLSNLEEKVKAADWVISGEGKLDQQSLEGKVIDGIAGLCEKHQKPLSLVVGINALSDQEFKKLAVWEILSITSISKNLEDAISNADQHLQCLGSQLKFA